MIYLYHDSFKITGENQKKIFQILLFSVKYFLKVEKKNVKALKQNFIQLNIFNLEDDFCYVF